MIRHAFDEPAVLAEIAALDAKWPQKAAARTAALLKAGQFNEAASIWSTVKPVFMRLQKNKCVFCERQFESPETGKIEFDLEHFRPKGSVEAWPKAGLPAGPGEAFPTGDPSPNGYYWLAYSLHNYAASCKVCNSTFKANYFPVAASRATAPHHDLSAEEAYLCYPLGDADTNPQSLLSFRATTAVPSAGPARERRRGQLIIDFFGLNLREQLHLERARMITLFGSALTARHQGKASDTDLRLLSRLSAPELPHANCLRSHEQLWRDDAGLARRIFEACRLYSVGVEKLPPAF